MATPHNFRTAFNGFHKEDVVRYLEYLNNKHQAQVNELTSEVDFLRDKLEALELFPAAEGDGNEAIAALTQERDDLRAKLEEFQARYDALAQPPAVIEVAEEDATPEEEETVELPETSAAPAAPVVVPVPQYGVNEELEAYRRAERTERLAKERADQLYRRTNGLLADTTAKVDGIAGEIGAMTEQVMAQLEALQAAVSSSKYALQDAAAAMHSLRPDNL